MALESAVPFPSRDPAMFRRFLTSGLAALVLTCSTIVLANDADEPLADEYRMQEGADAQALPAPAAEQTAISQASAAVVQAATAVAQTFVGIVSFYGREFAGRTTANGERFDPGILTMAHRTLAFGTLVRVTNLNNQRSVVVRVNDRGPFVGGRVGDLSAGAANLLGMLGAGVVQARLDVLGTALTQALK